MTNISRNELSIAYELISDISVCICSRFPFWPSHLFRYCVLFSCFLHSLQPISVGHFLKLFTLWSTTAFLWLNCRSFIIALVPNALNESIFQMTWIILSVRHSCQPNSENPLINLNINIQEGTPQGYCCAVMLIMKCETSTESEQQRVSFVCVKKLYIG